MKTSNKLLLGLFIVVLTVIVSFLVTARITYNDTKSSGNGKKASATREVEKFDKISVKGRVYVHLSQGKDQKFNIDADENLIPLVESSVENGELKIKLKSKINRKDQILLTITADSINSIDLLAGANLKALEEIKGNKLQVKTAAGSVAEMNLKYNELKGESHAGATIKFSGVTALATLIASSGSSILAEELVTKRCIAKGDAGAHVEANVTDELEVTMTSGSSFNYTGNPNIKKQNINSGGSIDKK